MNFNSVILKIYNQAALSMRLNSPYALNNIVYEQNLNYTFKQLIAYKNILLNGESIYKDSQQTQQQLKKKKKTQKEKKTQNNCINTQQQIQKHNLQQIKQINKQEKLQKSQKQRYQLQILVLKQENQLTKRKLQQQTRIKQQILRNHRQAVQNSARSIQQLGNLLIGVNQGRQALDQLYRHLLKILNQNYELKLNLNQKLLQDNGKNKPPSIKIKYITVGVILISVGFILHHKIGIPQLLKQCLQTLKDFIFKSIDAVKRLFVGLAQNLGNVIKWMKENLYTKEIDSQNPQPATSPA